MEKSKGTKPIHTLTTIVKEVMEPLPLKPIRLTIEGFWTIDKRRKFAEADKCFQNGDLFQAKEKYYAILKDYGHDEKVYYRLMEIYYQLQDVEDIVTSRNIAILLMGSNDVAISDRALKYYKNNTNRLLERGFANTIGSGKRRYIYIGKEAKSIRGADLMDESKQSIDWFFDLDRVPQELVFQPGHPQADTLYVANALSPNCYFPRKNIELELFEDKLLECINLMRCLGATRIKYQFKKGHSSSLNNKFIADIETKVGVKVVGVEADPKIIITEEKNQTADYYEAREQKFKPINKIHVPNNMVWYDSEPKWKSIVGGRMDRSLEQDDIYISTKKTNSITNEWDAKVKSNFRYLFVGVTGNFAFNEQEIFTEVEETEWSIHVDFAPLDEDLVPIDEKASNRKGGLFSWFRKG